MPTSPPSLPKLQAKAQRLKSKIAQVGDMRPGSLVERYRKCGKPSCHCARPGSGGHGPSFLVTHEVEGKTVTHSIPAGEPVEQTRQQIEEYKRFRLLTRELVDTSEQICEARLEQQTGGDIKKNRARRDPTGRTAPRDRNSGGKQDR
jgi:hypothetical protein